MKKPKRILLALLAVLLTALAGLLSLSASAEDAEPGQSGRTAAKAIVTPEIDGVEEDIWNTTAGMTYERNWVSNGKEAHQKAVVKMLWDADNLYILVRMEYNEAVSDRFVELRICERTDFAGLWNVSRENGGHAIAIRQDGTTESVYQIPVILQANRTLAVRENADGNGFVAELRVSRVCLSAFAEDTEIRFAASTYDHNYLNTGKLDNGVIYRGDGCRPTSCDTVTLVANPCTHETWLDATCLLPRHCAFCGLTDSESAVNPENHAGKQRAVCNEDGQTHNVVWPCCGAVTVSGEAHKWSNEAIVEREPTCTEAGTSAKECTVCHVRDGNEETLPPLGHEKGPWEQISAPTCRKKGTERIACTRCGKGLELRTVDELPHTGGDWIIEQEPAIDVPGKRYRTCTVCGQRFDEEILPALTGESTAGSGSGETDTTGQKGSGGCSGAVLPSVSALLTALLCAGLLRKRKKGN